MNFRVAKLMPCAVVCPLYDRPPIAAKCDMYVFMVVMNCMPVFSSDRASGWTSAAVGEGSHASMSVTSSRLSRVYAYCQRVARAAW
jgi:hypothetical protein